IAFETLSTGLRLDACHGHWRSRLVRAVGHRAVPVPLNRATLSVYRRPSVVKTQRAPAAASTRLLHDAGHRGVTHQRRWNRRPGELPPSALVLAGRQGADSSTRRCRDRSAGAWVSTGTPVAYVIRCERRLR